SEARKALAEVGLDLDVTLQASRLNTSFQQLLMIARALMKNPRILVLDEPTSALTLTESENLFRILCALKDRGVTCIYISHKLDEVFNLADQITVLRDGETISTFDRNDFKASAVIESMVGREISNLYPKEHVVPGDVALEVKNLRVRHPMIRGRMLVDGIGFHVKQGEILGIAGLVGSGRSEVLRTIYGAMKGSSAEVYVQGKHVAIRSPKDALANGITLLTEDRRKSGLIMSASIAENISLASLSAISKGYIVRNSMQKRAVMNMVSDLQIKAHTIFAPVSQLSGGNQQKVVVGKWLLTHPKVFLLDEPARGIDVGAKSELYKLISKLASEGTAIVMVSSELPELLEMCDRFIVLANGKISDQFDKADATESRVMMAATGVLGGGDRLRAEG
ncbi:MAG: sugar ABC transporter ATP-binding protein, partial [Armatimonadota bacterium]